MLGLAYSLRQRATWLDQTSQPDEQYVKEVYKLASGGLV
jgi:hypothetical protein